MSDVSIEEGQEELTDPENTEEEKTEEENPDEEEEVPEPLHLHTKTVPTIVMLFGGASAAIFTFIRHDPLLTSLIIIFVSLVIFLVLGDLIKLILDSIVIEPPEKETGEKDKVIERSSGEEAGETGKETPGAGAGGSTEEIQT
ncbi:MAG: hypothetical protein K5668_04660 [Lachnospiraceae bacterium]|nr:hypothetical protein [Lachnospiraceae bacterium]